MSVNLSKDPIKKLPEYTPIHLINEEESIQQRTPVTKPNESLGKLPEYTPIHLVSEEDTVSSESNEHGTHEKYNARFKPVSTEGSQSASAQTSKTAGLFSSIVTTDFSPSKLVYNAMLCISTLIITFFSKDITSFVVTVFAKVMKEDISAMADSVEFISTIVSTTGTIIAVFLVVDMIVQLVPCLLHAKRP